jgi:hypothetical protein
VRRVVVLESLVIGVAGLGLAAAGGLVLATMWVTQTFQLLLGWALQVSIPAPSCWRLVSRPSSCAMWQRALRPGGPRRSKVAEALRYD